MTNRSREQRPRLVAAEKEHGEAVRVLADLTRICPKVPLYRSTLAAALDNQANVLCRLDDVAGAYKLFDQAQTLHLGVTGENPSNAVFRSKLRNHYAILAGADSPSDQGNQGTLRGRGPGCRTAAEALSR